MSRHTNISTYESFFNVLTQTMSSFAIKLNVTRNQYFANLLGFKTDSSLSQHLSTNSNLEKNISMRETISILDICNNEISIKPVLDHLCQRYGYICATPATAKQNNNNFEKLFMDISILLGDIAQSHQKFMSDGQLDIEEQKTLDKKLYQVRSLIKSYEFDTDSKEDDEC